MTDLPSGVKALVDRVAAQDPDSPTYLDPGKSDEREAIEYFLDRSGKSADRYPALHRALADGGVGVPGEPLDRCMLAGAGEADDGTATAQTWVGSHGRSFISGAHTMLVDAEGGGILASGSSTQVGGGLIRNATGADASAPAQRMTGVSFFHAQRSPGEPVRFGLAAEEVAAVNPPTITVAEPRKIRSKVPGRIVIGMARQQGWQNSDCDYIYPSSGNVEPDRLVVPFRGQAVFPEAVKLPAKNPVSWLWCESQPLGLLQPVSYLVAGFKQLSPTTIEWSFPFDDQPINKTKSLQFEPLLEADDNLSSFYFKFQVVTQATGAALTATVCSTSWPKPPSGCKTIEDIQYWWHCVDANALVTLPDGSKKKLIEINQEIEVQLLSGGKALVEATTLDIHDVDSEDEMLQLQTASGRSLAISEHHPLFVAGAPVMACDVQPGDEIAVEGGVDRVTSCQPLPDYSGLIGNLSLAATGTNAFFANGIAVGDFNTLTAHRNQIRHDPDYMLPRLPETHHQDFLSALADATSR